MEENKTIDVLIYHDNTSTSIIRVDSVKSAITQFRAFKGEDAVIDEVYIFDRHNNDPEAREKVEDWDKEEK